MFSLMGNDQMSQTGPAVMDQPCDVTHLHADPSEGPPRWWSCEGGTRPHPTPASNRCIQHLLSTPVPLVVGVTPQRRSDHSARQLWHLDLPLEMEQNHLTQRL